MLFGSVASRQLLIRSTRLLSGTKTLISSNLVPKQLTLIPSTSALMSRKLATQQMEKKGSCHLFITFFYRNTKLRSILAMFLILGELPHDFSGHFKLERLWIVGMVPLFPAALFIHNSFMDYALALAISLHVYWYVLMNVHFFCNSLELTMPSTTNNDHAFHSNHTFQQTAILHYISYPIKLLNIWTMRIADVIIILYAVVLQYSSLVIELLTYP